MELFRRVFVRLVYIRMFSSGAAACTHFCGNIYGGFRTFLINLLRFIVSCNGLYEYRV